MLKKEGEWKTWKNTLSWLDLLVDSKTDFEPETFEKNDSVTIFWSSGTTGDPKGVLLSFDMMARLVLAEKSVFVDSSVNLETFIMTTNFFHAGGFTFALINGIKSCNNIVIFSDGIVKASDLHQAIDYFHPTVLKLGSHHAIELGYSQPLFESLNLSSVEYILPMGAPVYKGKDYFMFKLPQ